MTKTAKTYRFSNATIEKLKELEQLENNKKERGLVYKNSTQLVEDAILKYHDLVIAEEAVEDDEKMLIKKMYREVLKNQEALWTVLKLLNKFKGIKPSDDEEIKDLVSVMQSIYKKPIEDIVSKKIIKETKKKLKGDN